MATKLINLKYVDQVSLYLIKGIIRRCEILLSNKNNCNFNAIPNIISHIILSFYCEIELFNINLCGKYINISPNCKIMDNKGSKGWGTVYGTRIINPLIDNIYIWKFKNIGTTTKYLSIGIDNAMAKCINDKLFKTTYKASYCYYARGGIFSWNGDNNAGEIEKLSLFEKKDNILTMKLTLTKNQNTLSFKVNDENEFVAFTNITREKYYHYRLAVSCKNKQFVSIKLMYFTIVLSK